jgi:uncharacterized protein involved in exopolysaccharide biosynthesis
MELRSYLSIVTAYRAPLILIPLIAAAIGLLATFFMSPQYTGVATVQIVPDQVEPGTVSLRTQDGSGSAAIGFQGATELLSFDVTEGLATREVAAAIVGRLGLDARPAPEGFAAIRAWVRSAIRDAWDFARFGYVTHKQGTEAAIDEVTGALKPQLVRGSYFMRIAANWNDPSTASDIANAAVQAYLAQSRRLAVAAATERSRFLEGQVAEARQAVEAAREAVLSYSHDTDVVAGESVRAAVGALDASRASRQQAEQRLAEVRQQFALAQHQLDTTDPQSATEQTQSETAHSANPAQNGDTSITTRSTTRNPVYQVLQERATALEQDITGLEARAQDAAGKAQADALDSARAEARHTDLELAATRQALTVAEGELAATEPQLVTEQRTNQQTQQQGDQRSNQRTQQNTDVGGSNRGGSNTSNTTGGTVSGSASDNSSSKSTSSTTGTTVSPVINPLYSNLQQRVASLRQDIATLETRQRDAERQVAAAAQDAAAAATRTSDQALNDARQRLALVQDQLATTPPDIVDEQRSDQIAHGAPEPSTTTTSSTVRTAAPNPVYESLQERVYTLQQEVTAAESRSTGGLADYNAREAALQDAIARDGQLSALTQKLNLASETYSRRYADWQNALLEQARPVDQIRMIDPSVAPVYPSSPIKIFWAGIALAAGLLVAIVLVFVHHSIDVSVRSARDVESALGMAFLASVPMRRLVTANGHRNGHGTPTRGRED